MDEREQNDLDRLKAEIQKEKLTIYDYMVHIMRCDEKGLLHAGYRNGIPSALHDIMESSQRKIIKLTKEYIKKYPDEGM